MLILDTDSQSSEAPLSPSPSFAGNTATPFCLLAREPTRTSFTRILRIIDKEEDSREGLHTAHHTYTRNDSSGVTIENTSSAGQDRAGTKRDVEGCLGKAILITASDKVPEWQQRIMEEATVTSALGRGDAPRRSHATNCQDS